MPTHPLGSDRGGSSGYGTAKMCRNPVLEKDQPCGVSDTTQGIPKARSASLPRTNLGVVCRGSDKVSNFSRAMISGWQSQVHARLLVLCQGKQWGWLGVSPRSPRCWGVAGRTMAQLLLPRWVMPFPPSDDAGTSLLCSHSHLVTGHKGDCS